MSDGDAQAGTVQALELVADVLEDLATEVNALSDTVCYDFRPIQRLRNVIAALRADAERE